MRIKIVSTLLSEFYDELSAASSKRAADCADDID